MTETPDDENLKVIEFDSQLLEEDNLFDFWRETLRPLFLGETKKDHNPEDIYHKTVKIDNIVVAKSGFSSQLFLRNRKHLLRNDDSDHIVVQWYIRGGCHVDNGGHDFIQSPEHIVMMDLGHESFSNTIAPFSEVVTIVLPREFLQEFWGPIDNLAGLSLPINSTRGALLKNFMVSLCEQLDTIKLTDATTIAQTTAHMVSSMFQNKFRHIETTPEIVEIELRLLIQNFIVANLRNSQLNADVLIERFHCSRSTLYRLFQAYGGINHYITQLRLQRCYKQLVSGDVKRSQITKTAQYWGFNNRQQFSRLFRQYFNISPSDLITSNDDRVLAEELNRNFMDNIDNVNIDSHKLASWFKQLGRFTP